MWQEAKANEKRVKELIADHKRRAERRRAYYESKLGDPKQLLRIIGSTVKLYPNAEQYYYHENTNNLMPWQGDTNIKIDRFDGRSLLDYIPKYENIKIEEEEDDFSDREELNFERYHDLVEAERLNVAEKERLTTVEEEWTKLLDRHKALLAMINPKKSKNSTIGFDYGTSSASDPSLINDDEKNQESELLYDTDILEYVNDLTDKDKRILNEMGMKYGIRNYTRLLRVAKRDRDEELKQLKMKQNQDGNLKKDGSRKSRKRKRRRRRYSIEDDNNHGNSSRYKRRGSPTYGNYDDDEDGEDDYTDDETNSSENDTSGDDNQSDFVIEFGSTIDETQQQKKTTIPNQNQKESKLKINDSNGQSTILSSTNTNINDSSSSKLRSNEKKLTPMEKLKMKMRAGLEKTIQSDANDKIRKEKERQLEDLQQYALHHDSMNDFNPSIININNDNASLSQLPTTTQKSNTRYRSPSSSPERKSTTSPSSQQKNKSTSLRKSNNNNRYRSPSTDSASSASDSKYQHKRHHYHNREENNQNISNRFKQYGDKSTSRSQRRRSRSRSRNRSPHRKSSKSGHHHHHHHHNHHNYQSKSSTANSSHHKRTSYSSLSPSRKRSTSPENSYYRSSRSYKN
ncbi:alternative splicing regulator-domain-containing protein [Cunninghamella echinulata]|nr:alternative splicing regulator-domain-containing protein [Cunninghamella echinulata]